MAQTIDEIRTKYQCDKRQTGQVVVNPIRAAGGNAGFDFRKSGIKDKKVEGALKREIRAVNKPGDPLANGEAKKIRDAKALVLKELNSMATYVKKLNDIRQIRDNLERIVPRMLGYLK